MPDQTILCPHCQQSIPLSQALSEQVKHELEAQFAQEQEANLKKLQEQAVALEKEKQLLASQRMTLVKQQEALRQELAEKLAEQKKTIEAESQLKLESEKKKMWTMAQQKAAEKAREETQLKLKELEDENRKKTDELRKAEQLELELRKKSREVEEKAQKLELEVQRKIDEERQKIAEDAKKQADEENRLKSLEKDKQLEMMRKQIEELKRKSEQGSMQIQGEVQEEDLKQILQSAFPIDIVEDVEKGIRGADLVQTVMNSYGQQCGVILWESKNTQAWNDQWVKKLKEDQNIVKADVSVIVSKVLPRGVESHTVIQNVWVVDYQSVLLLTQALRIQLQQICQVKSSLVGREEKMEVLYTYLSGTQFKNRVENIVSAFISMQEQLIKERRAMQAIWNRREKEIERVINNTTGMYGDLQGIIGGSLPSIHQLELPDGEVEDGELGLFPES